MKLAKYIKPYLAFALLAPITMIGEVLMDLFQPDLLSKIVDDGVLGGNFTLIWQTGLLMLGVAILGGCCGVLSGVFASKASQSFGSDLRNDVFKKIMYLSYEQNDKFTTGSLITRLTNDVTAVTDFVSMLIRMFVRAPMQFFGGIIMALMIDIKFGIVMIVSMPIQILVVVLIFKKGGKLFKIVQKKLDKVNSTSRENIIGARIIKSLVRENREIDKFNDANDDLVGTTYKVQKLMSLMSPCLMIIMNVSVVAIIYIGGWQVEAGSIGVGSIMAAITYITQVLMSMMMVGMMFMQVTRAKASSDRILELLNTEPAVKSGDKKLDGDIDSIEFDDVTFAYPGSSGVPAIKNLSLKIKKGETLAILGATGSGKTSLVSLITRFYDVTDGSIKVNGVDVREYDLASLRAKIGFVLQKSELFSGTVMDNILYGSPDKTVDDAKAAASIAQVDEIIEKFKDGYDTVIGEKGASLSGGQKQRISIARSITRAPEVLVFDDSTSALDFKTESKLQSAMQKNLKGTTVLLIAQRIASVKNADRIAVIDNGELAALGTNDELMQTSEIYRDIYNSQIKKGATAVDA